ncbi:MAG: TIGR00341 family protein [Candidatus Krumholzibacteriota bacterium]|nr:TIGR00341 family protein [Candidatus Krumholzibacteriota bacterium]
MSLRMIEIVIPEAEMPALEEILKERAATRIWTETIAEGKGRAKVLMPPELVESTLDALRERFGGSPGFRAMLLRVEATVPEIKVDEERKEQKEKAAAAAATPDADRISREELYEAVLDGARLSRIYFVMVVLSTLVAAIGLTRGDVAVIIGAMVIAPLLGPNVAMALATTLGDTTLLRKGLAALGAGVAVSGALSVGIGLVIHVDPSAPQLAARASLGISDVLLAVTAGIAGTFSYTTGLPTALIGVMVAVALLPPLVTAGLLLGGGMPDLALRAAALLVTNIACVNLAGVVTFLAQRVRPRRWWEEERARRAARISIAIWVVVLAVLVAAMLLFWRV